jgi:hypothetical protein
MKKLFFTAIALVAFSGLSNANTAELEENQTVLKKNPCESSAALLMSIFEENHYNEQVNNGVPPDQIVCIDSFTYNTMYYAYLANCR